ncbi:MAG: hypothetical protein HY927_09810 [Elusimicrobia bacterium]|nr:hypothetical protein [Elusimicrobiota bacterium]
MSWSEQQAIAETNANAKAAVEAANNESLPPEEKAKAIEGYKAKVETGLARFPESSGLNAAAAEFSYGLGEYQEGLGRAEKSVELAQGKKDDKALGTALVARGRGRMGLGDYDSAYADAMAALKADPRNQAAYGLKMLTQGRAAGGRGAAGAPAAPDGGAPGGAPAPKVDSALAGHAASGGPRGPSGLTPGTAGGGTSPADGLEALGHIKRAENAMGLGDWASARQHAGLALARSPEHPGALKARAIAAMRLGDHQAALADAQAALKARPDAPSLLVLRATALNAAGRPSEAHADADRALALEPRFAAAFLQRGLAREKLGQPKAMVLADLAKAQELDPSLASYYQEALARLDPARAAPARQAGAPSPRRVSSCPLNSRLATLLMAALAAGVVVGLAMSFSRRRP